MTGVDFITDKRRSFSDSRSGFSSFVDSRKVSDPERREQLALSIRQNRNDLIEMLGIPPQLACCGDWTNVQRTIHSELGKLKDEEVRIRAERCIDDLLDAEEELVEGNLRLVLMVVRRYSRCGYMGALEEMDLVQEGCLGLLDAVRRFDFSGNSGFMTYAVIRIRKKVLLSMEKQQRLVRIPSHVVKKGMFLREVIDEFASREGRYPLPHEIEKETGESLDVPLLLSLSEKVIPLHSIVGETGIPLSEQLPCNGPLPEDTALTEMIDSALGMLDDRSKLVVIMRFGLYDGEAQTLSSIAEVIGLSIERTRQIEKASVRTLADYFSGFGIVDWLRGD